MSEKKIAVVTGASSGLGRAMAHKFKKEGFYVVTVSRKAPEDGVCDRHIAADLTDRESLEAAAQEILKLEKVEIFIVCSFILYVFHCLFLQDRCCIKAWL